MRASAPRRARATRRPPSAPGTPAPPAAAPEAAPTLTPEQARLLPYYHDLKNEIVEPDRVVVSSQYFWTRWAPRLGPTLTALVVCLRRHCYYNKLTQERRDWCFPEQATLAREIGVETTKTVRAALAHPLAALFVRREPRYVYDPGRGKKVRTSDMYYVAMDDPLTPEDEALLAQRAAARLLAEGRAAELLAPPDGRNDRQVAPAPARPSPGGPNDPQVVPPAGPDCPQDSTVISAPEEVPLKSTDTSQYDHHPVDVWYAVLSAYAAANAAEPTPALRARLAALAAQFEPAARRADPPATGAHWVLAAIREAVESGSHYVAPRRIAHICARWSREGFPVDLLAADLDPRLAPAEESIAEQAGDGALAPSPQPSPRGRGSTAPVEADSGNGAKLPAMLPLPLGEGWGEGEAAPAFDDPAEPDESLPADPPEAAPEGTAPSRSFVVYPELGLLSRPLWRAIGDEARGRLLAPGDRKLLDASQLVGRVDEVLYVGLPGRAAAKRAESCLAQPLTRAARAILGRPVELRFVSFGDWPAR